MKLVLIRMREDDFATYGRLEAEDFAQLGVTIERPWIDADADGRRDTNVSRIVAGTYRCVRRVSPKRGYEVWWLCGVPDVTLAPFAHEPGMHDATTCQIHIANLPSDLNGCIGIGTAFGEVRDQPGITGSKRAFEKLMAETKDVAEFTLVVLDVPAGA